MSCVWGTILALPYLPWELPCPAAAVAMANADAGDMVQRGFSPDVTKGQWKNSIKCCTQQ